MHLMKEEDKANLEFTIRDYKLLYFLEKDDTFYFFHRTILNKVLMMPHKDLYTIHAAKKLPNGEWMEVFKSFDHPEYPEELLKEQNFERIFIYTGALIFKDPEVTWNSIGVESETEIIGEHGAKMIMY